MIYSLKDKLDFEKNPRIEVTKGKYYEVKSDAATVLELLDILKNNDEIEAAIKAGPLLFNKKDHDALLKMQYKDYVQIIGASVNLALGSNPDEEVDNQGED